MAVMYRALGWSEIADRVWVGRYQSLDQTIGVIAGDDGLAVIDTLASHHQADGLKQEVRNLSPLSIAAVINTHGHWDHCFGNARFLPAPIWGHVLCGRMVTETGDEQRRMVVERWMPEASEELAEVELTPPTHQFEAEASIQLGNRLVQMSYLGRGHSDNDIVTSVVGADILFVGDLLENAPAPVFSDSFPLEWGETARLLLDRVEGQVVPGHGDPFGIEFATHQAHQLSRVAALCKSALAGETTWDEVATRSPFSHEATTEAIERTRMTGIAAASE